MYLEIEARIVIVIGAGMDTEMKRRKKLKTKSWEEQLYRLMNTLKYEPLRLKRADSDLTSLRLLKRAQRVH